MTLGFFVGYVASYFSTTGLTFIPFFHKHQDLLGVVIFASVFAIYGLIFGVALAVRRTERIALRKAVLGFGSGFLISGAVGFLLDVGVRDLRNDYNEGFRLLIGWAQFFISFALAGALSAAFTRGRLFSVVNSVASVTIGWTIIIILSYILKERLSNYPLIAFLIYCALFNVIIGALLNLRKSEASANFQDSLQPQA
jgi:hypothetical protein